MANDVWTNPSGPSAGTASLSEMQEQRTDNLEVVRQTLMEGDVSVSGQVHRHRSGTLATLSTYGGSLSPGNAGRRFFATDVGCEFIDDGTSWLILPATHAPSVSEYFHDDFLYDPSAGNGASTSGLWTPEVSGSGVVAIVDSSGSLVSIDTGTTNGSVALLKSGKLMYAVSASRAPAIFEWIFSLNTTASAGWRFGLTSANDPSSDANAIYFLKSDGAGQDNAWSTNTKLSGTPTTNATAITGTTKRRFTIVVMSTTSVKFYIDGVLQFTHTTNIPTANLRPCVRVTNSAAVSRGFNMDAYWHLAKRA